MAWALLYDQTSNSSSTSIEQIIGSLDEKCFFDETLGSCTCDSSKTLTSFDNYTNHLIPGGYGCGRTDTNGYIDIYLMVSKTASTSFLDNTSPVKIVVTFTKKSGKIQNKFACGDGLDGCT